MIALKSWKERNTISICFILNSGQFKHLHCQNQCLGNIYLH